MQGKGGFAVTIGGDTGVGVEFVFVVGSGGGDADFLRVVEEDRVVTPFLKKGAGAGGDDFCHAGVVGA